MEYLYLIISILSLSASILAWIAKIRWSSQYREAKEAQISTIKEQIVLLKEQNSHLKEFNSEKIMNLYLSTKEGLEIINDKILDEKKVLEKKISEMNSEIERLKVENQKHLKIPDFSYLEKINSQISNTMQLFSSNYINKIKEMNENLEKIKKLNSSKINVKFNSVLTNNMEEE